MDNLGLIIAIVGTGIALIGVVITMMYWVRAESNSVRAEAKEDRKDIVSLIYAIQLEMKDFHHKLIDIARERGK